MPSTVAVLSTYITSFLASVTCHRLSRTLETRRCISPCTFNPGPVHILQLHLVYAVICFVVVARFLAKGSFLTSLSRYAVLMPYFDLSKIVFHTALLYARHFTLSCHCFLMHSAQYDKCSCTKGDSQKGHPALRHHYTHHWLVVSLLVLGAWLATSFICGIRFKV